jgi:hypothetical protein
LVETPLVLYLQEDYFLERPVRVDLIDRWAARMLADPTIHHIGLTHFGSRGPFHETEDAALCRIDPKARYRLSCQAGLWRVDTLASHVRPDDNGWTFEILGSVRASRVEETFLTVNPAIFRAEGDLVVAYTHTGIIKGRWHPAIPELFARHGLAMDFSRRGMHVPRSKWLSRLATGRRILRSPGALMAALLGR